MISPNERHRHCVSCAESRSKKAKENDKCDTITRRYIAPLLLLNSGELGGSCQKFGTLLLHPLRVFSAGPESPDSSLQPPGSD